MGRMYLVPSLQAIGSLSQLQLRLDTLFLLATFLDVDFVLVIISQLLLCASHSPGDAVNIIVLCADNASGVIGTLRMTHTG